ncbi:MAG: hypothetical protein WCQ95_12950 [Bacteroidota bacterium]
MKQYSILTVLVILLFSFGCTSQKFDKLIIGDWKVYKIESNNSQLDNRGERRLIDSTDGFIFTNKNVCTNKFLIPRGDEISTGKYSLNDSVLNLFNNQKAKILKLNNNELTFKDENDQTWYCLKTEYYSKLSQIEKTELQRYSYYDSLKISKIKLQKELESRMLESKDIYTKVPIMPVYPNGEKGIDGIINKYYQNTFLTSNEISPAGVDYRYIQFVVEADGSVTYPAINVNNIKDYDFFIRVIEKIGKWIPGKIDGKTVAVKMELQFRMKK